MYGLLTFKATDFEARSDATYRVNIKATKGNETAEKILAVTVTNSLLVTSVMPVGTIHS
jgi:hypothetical protein